MQSSPSNLVIAYKIHVKHKPDELGKIPVATTGIYLYNAYESFLCRDL